jgi:hypothetical protein
MESLYYTKKEVVAILGFNFFSSVNLTWDETTKKKLGYLKSEVDAAAEKRRLKKNQEKPSLSVQFKLKKSDKEIFKTLKEKNRDLTLRSVFLAGLASLQND